jgi:hypothetical protein
MAVGHAKQKLAQQHSRSMSHWDRISWEDFFHPDWDDDGPSVLERTAGRGTRRNGVDWPVTGNRSLARRTTQPISRGTIVTGAVVIVAAGFLLSRIASLLSNY